MLGGGLIGLGLAATVAVPASNVVDVKAQEVIDRTRITTAEHVIYYRAYSFVKEANPRVWWSAVFHQGTRYRTESAWFRIVADCSIGAGVQVALRARKDRGNAYSVDPKYAKQACGISAEREILSAKWLGQKQGQFGISDQVEISEKKGTYLYTVGQRGEILGVIVTHRGETTPIVTEAVVVEYKLPDGDLFSRESLRRSMVARAI